MFQKKPYLCGVKQTKLTKIIIKTDGPDGYNAAVKYERFYEENLSFYFTDIKRDIRLRPKL